MREFLRWFRQWRGLGDVALYLALLVAFAAVCWLVAHGALVFPAGEVT